MQEKKVVKHVFLDTKFHKKLKQAAANNSCTMAELVELLIEKKLPELLKELHAKNNR